MRKTIAYFRAKARTCRRLAKSIGGETVPAVAELEALAVEFDALAGKLESAGAVSVLDDLKDGPSRPEAMQRRH